MKKQTITFAIALGIAIISTLFLAVAAHAKGSSHPQDGNGEGSRISFDALPRTMTFYHERNSVADDGTILVCPYPHKAGGYNDGACIDKAGANAWQRVEWVTPPGFKLASYEYRFVGSSGWRILILYFAPKQEPKAALIQKDDIKLVSPQFTGPVTIQADRVIVQRNPKKH